MQFSDSEDLKTCKSIEISISKMWPKNYFLNHIWVRESKKERVYRRVYYFSLWCIMNSKNMVFIHNIHFPIWDRISLKKLWLFCPTIVPFSSSANKRFNRQEDKPIKRKKKRERENRERNFSLWCREKDRGTTWFTSFTSPKSKQKHDLSPITAFPCPFLCVYRSQCLVPSSRLLPT